MVPPKKKVLFITYYWPPSGGAGVQRSLKFVNYLPEFGIEPVVLTVDESVATYPVRDETLSREVDASTRVIRTDSFEPLRWLSRLTGGKAKIPHGGFTGQRREKWSQRILRFIRGNFFIPDARVGWVRHAVKTADRIIRQEAIETVLISSPPHSSQLIGLELKKRFPKIHWMADMRDPWTDIYYYAEFHMMEFVKAKDKQLERAVFENASSEEVVSDSLARLFAGKSTSIDSSKIHVIPNGFDGRDFKQDIVPPADVFRLTYVGTLAESYRPELFFNVLAEVMSEFSEVRFQVRFVGSPSVSLKHVLETEHLSDVTEFIGHVPHAEAVGYMRSSSVLLLFIPDVDHAEGILTGKLFEYLGSRVPVVGNGPVNGDAAAILKETGAGLLFDRMDKQGLKNHLRDLVERWKTNSDLRHTADIRKYERREQARQLASILSTR